MTLLGRTAQIILKLYVKLCGNRFCSRFTVRGDDISSQPSSGLIVFSKTSLFVSIFILFFFIFSNEKNKQEMRLTCAANVMTFSNEICQQLRKKNVHHISVRKYTLHHVNRCKFNKCHVNCIMNSKFNHRFLDDRIRLGVYIRH